MKVLVTGNISPEALAIIRASHQVEANGEDKPMERERLLRTVVDRQGLLCMITDRIDEEVMDAAPHLKMIANYGVGYNNIDVEAAAKRKIPVSNTPDVLTDATADLAFALILAVARRVVEGDRRARAGRFRFWAPSHFLGNEVSGKTLGIIGLGRIGKAVARRAAGFDMKVCYHNRKRLGLAEEKNLKANYASFDDLLTESDFLSLHVPLTAETRHLIGLGELKRMKPTSFLINTSRGPVVDEDALVHALRIGDIAGAGLDVYEREPELAPGLIDLDNAVLLPHMGSATVETRRKMAMLAAENLLAGLQGTIPPDCVNCDAIFKGRHPASFSME